MTLQESAEGRSAATKLDNPIGMRMTSGDAGRISTGSRGCGIDR